MRILSPLEPDVSLGMVTPPQAGGVRHVPPVVVLAALLIGLALAAPVYAAPILTAGDYTLHIQGAPTSVGGYAQTATQPIIGDFSASLSNAADVITSEPSTAHVQSAASVSLSMSDSRIEAFMNVSASTTDPIWAPALAQVDMQFSFTLTEALFVDGTGQFDLGSPSSYGYSGWSFDGLSSGIGVTPPGFDLACNPQTLLCFKGILPAGSYTVTGYALAVLGGPGAPASASSAPSFVMNMAPIPEASAAILFASGFVVVGSYLRWRRRLPT